MQVATLDSKRFDGPVVRVRSQVFREFMESPTNPSIPLLVTTTDIRTPKVSQLTADPISEIAWWIEGASQQFRILSDIFLVPALDNPHYARWRHVLATAQPGTALGLFKEEDWEARRVALFRTMSAHMKASWCRPVPGSVLKGGEDEAKSWPERVEEPNESMSEEEYKMAKRNWDAALSNFALMLVDPIEIDFVDVGVNPNTRSLFTKTLDGINVTWNEQALVP
jgi:pyridoxamine 5'-phosphate oxidase